MVLNGATTNTMENTIKKSPKKDPYNFVADLRGRYVVRGYGDSVKPERVGIRGYDNYLHAIYGSTKNAFRVVRMKRKPSGSGSGGGGGNSW